MTDLRKFNGGNSTKAIRPDDKRLLTKTELQNTYDTLSPFIPKTLSVIEAALDNGERWSVELVVKYLFALPTARTEQISTVNSDFNIKDLFQFTKTNTNEAI